MHIAMLSVGHARTYALPDPPKKEILLYQHNAESAFKLRVVT
jgi:hypothetical protein